MHAVTVVVSKGLPLGLSVSAPTPLENDVLVP